MVARRTRSRGSAEYALRVYGHSRERRYVERRAEIRLIDEVQEPATL